MATSIITSEINDGAGASIAGVQVVARLLPRPCFETSTGIELAAITSTTTDSNGQWSLTLTETASITPSGSYYEITEYVPDRYGGPVKNVIQVGAANASMYASLVTSPPAQSVATFLTQTAGDARYAPLGTSFATTAESRPGDAASAGSGTDIARANHVHDREQVYGTAADRAALTGTDLYEGLRYHETDTDKFWQYINSAWTQVTTTWINTQALKPAVATAGESVYISDAANITSAGIYTPDTTSQPARVGNIWWHNGTRWQYGEWGKPWGIVGVVDTSASTTGVTAVTDITGLTITFTAAANRRIKITANVLLASSVAGDIIRATITDGSNTVLQIGQVAASVASQAETVQMIRVLSPSAGSVTYKCRLERLSGTGTMSHTHGATFPGQLLIEDIGPNGAPA